MRKNRFCVVIVTSSRQNDRFFKNAQRFDKNQYIIILALYGIVVQNKSTWFALKIPF